MLKMRSNFFSVTNALIYAAIGLLFGLAAYEPWVISIAGYVVPDWELYTVAGLGFLMAYSALLLTK